MKNADQDSLNPDGFARANRPVATTQLSRQVRLGLLILVASFCASAAGQTSPWTWVGGSNTAGQPGVYGNLGVPAPGNEPGGREDAVTWTDGSGNIWLFGGNGVDSKGNQGALNDLWMFNLSTNQWVWMSGSSVLANSYGWTGVYGNLGTPAAGNTPGSRIGAAGWTDKSGNLWLFGGEGLDANDYEGWLNDFWEFNPTTKEWTWMGGSSTLPTGNSGTQTQPGVYGTLGVPAAGNIPAGRQSPIGWVDSNGNFWLFGGGALDVSTGVNVTLNDLWEFNPTTKEWAWIGGSSAWPTGDDFGWGGVYGTLGSPAASNFPGSRSEAVGWADTDGNLWLFGGRGQDGGNNGIDSSGNTGELNDLWKFNLASKKWTWIAGSNYINQAGVYGALGVAGAQSVPSAREGAVSWVDGSGNFWLLGGFTNAELNDLWVFDRSLNQWAWMSGSQIPDQPGIYGSLGQSGSTNAPGGREGASSWTDSSGNLRLFGGYGGDVNYTSAGRDGYLNDVWEYEAPAAAPTFSPAAGTYNSAQTVTINDATPGATIYFTTEAFMPTTSWAVYSGPFTLTAQATVEAYASASGYSNSVAASAAYNISLVPPAFTLGASPTSLTVNAGSQGSVTLTVTPQNGFNSTVGFACSGLPSGASCSFNPTTVTPSGGAATTQLTISASAQAASLRRDSPPFLPTTVLAVALCLIGWKRRRRGLQLLLLVAAFVALGLFSACGGAGGTGGGGGGGGGTQPVNATVTVTATSGSLQQTTTISLTVN